ncbi:MAG: hypothetical protein LBQ95_08435 [Lachnospiraceae bacterium]|nr:hypothetical protein [Lachnospiraceae bacterium]
MSEEYDGEYEQFYSELTHLENRGIFIFMDGVPASPSQVVSAHMFREESDYMRDYTLGDDGNIKEVSFINVTV